MSLKIVAYISYDILTWPISFDTKYKGLREYLKLTDIKCDGDLYILINLKDKSIKNLDYIITLINIDYYKRCNDEEYHFTDTKRCNDKTFEHTISKLERKVFLLLNDKPYHFNFDENISLFNFNNDSLGPLYLQFMKDYIKIRDYQFGLIRGDLISNQGIGYRNNGIFIYDGDKVTDLYYNEDDNGSISPEYKLITEFPIGYWYSKIEHNDYGWIDPYKLDVINIYRNINDNNDIKYIRHVDGDINIIHNDKFTKFRYLGDFESDNIHIITVKYNNCIVNILTDIDEHNTESELYQRFITYNLVNQVDKMDWLIITKDTRICTYTKDINRSDIIKQSNLLPKVLLNIVNEYDI